MKTIGGKPRSLCISLVLGSALALPLTLTAQQQGPLEEITVTGSYLSRPANRPQPVAVLDNVELEQQNKGSISEIFKEMPQVAGSVSTINWNQGANSATNTVNLRGLGARATLVLLNGKRQTIDASANNAGVSAVDVDNLAPGIMIQRIEVMTDGASALYGSDAVAGVVNFITRNDFEGAELKFQGLWNEAGSSTPEFNLQGIYGSQGDKTSVVAGFEYASTEELRMEQRFSAERIRDGGASRASIFGNPGNFQPATPMGGPAGAPFPDPLCGDPSIAVSDDGDEHGFINPNGLCAGNGAYGRGIIPDSQRFNGLALITHHFDNDITGNLEIGFARTRYDNPFGTGLPIVAQPRPFVPATNPGVIAANAADPSFVIRDYLVWFRENSPAFEGASRQKFKQDTFRLAGALDGEIGATGWNWRAAGTYSVNDSKFVDVESIRSRLDLVLRGLGGPNCNQATGVPGVGDCQYWNPFANRMTAQPGDAHFNDPELLKWFSSGRAVEGTAELITAEVIVDGDLGGFLELPGGRTGIALGAQWRTQSFSQDWDDITNDGGWSFNTQAFNDWDGSRDTKAAFIELGVYPTDWAEIQLAARYEETGNSDSIEPKIGILLTPWDGVFLRGTWGTSFRVPGEVQSFGSGPGGGDARVLGGQQINARGQTTGDPNLRPESSESFTAGVTWDVTENLTLDLDYWTIDFEDLIVQENATTILTNDIADGFITDPRIVLFPGAPNEVCAVTGTPAGSPQCMDGFDIQVFDLSFINQDFQSTSGLDFKIDYRHFAFGADWGARINGSWILEYEVTSEGQLFKGVGKANASNQGVPMPEWRVNSTIDMRRGNHYARVDLHFIDKLEDDSTELDNEEETFTTVDLMYDYTLPWGNGQSNITLSVTNLLNRDEPLARGVLGPTTSVYEQRGRRYGVAWKHAF